MHILKRFTFIYALIGILLISTMMQVSAQEPVQPANFAELNADCVTVEALMNLPTNPAMMIQGGGILQSGEPVQGAITPEDAGDRWILGVPAASTATLTFENDLPLTVTLFQGLDSMSEENVPAGGGSLEVQLPSAGYYTLLVTRISIVAPYLLDRGDAKGTTGSYTLTVQAPLAQPLSPDTPIEITSSDPQQWIFYARVPSGLLAAELSFQFETEIPLQVDILSGETSLTSAGVSPGSSTITARIQASGYYALAITPQNENGNYTFSVSAVRDAATQFSAILMAFLQPRWEQAINPPLLAPTEGYLSAPVGDSNVQLLVAPDVARHITIAPSILLSLSSEIQDNYIRFLQSQTQAVSLLDGDLHLSLNNGGYIYIQDYDWEGQLADDSGNFATLVLPDDRAVRVDWTTAQNVYLLPNCTGIELRDGSRIIAEGHSVTARPAAGVDGFPITITEPVDYTINVEWENLDRIVASGGLVQLDFDNYTHTIHTDRTRLRVRHDETGLDRVIDEDTPFISTDWENIASIEVVGQNTAVLTQDDRGLIQRSEVGLTQMQSEDAVIRLIWSDNTESLSLPESEDYLQLEIPPVPVSYDPQVLPGNRAYLPATFNNTGQECYPVNTALDLNCASNGGVNPTNGNLTFSVTDLYVRGYRLDLTLSRTYNSQSFQVDSPFGHGWTTDYLLDFDAVFNADAAAPRHRLITSDNDYLLALDVRQAFRGQVLFTTPSGSRHVFNARQPGAIMTSDTLPGWEIAARPNILTDGWQVRRGDGLVYEFDRAGRLQAVEHPHGGSLRVSREQGYPDSIYRIQDDVGRSIVLEFDAAQHITRSVLNDVDGTVLGETQYTYENGLLVGVVYEDGSTATYRYNEQNQLVAHDDPRSPIARELYYIYDERGRVTMISPDDDFIRPYLAYVYESSRDGLVTTVTDEWGAETIWRYSISNNPTNAYRLIERILPDSETITYNYSSRGLIVGIEYPQYTLNLDYSANGELDMIENRDAAIAYNATYTAVPVGEQTVSALSQYQADDTIQASYNYDAVGFLETITSGDGVETRIVERHPEFGLPTLLEITYPDLEPAIETVQLTYDARGYLVKRQGWRGTQHFSWDRDGRLISYSDELDRSYALNYEHGSEGQCITLTDPLAVATRYCFDLRQNLLEQTTLAGNTVLQQTFYHYDEFDRLLEQQEILGEESLVTRYEYNSGLEDGFWRMTETNPAGQQLTTEYDSRGRVVRIIDALDRETTFEYQVDSRGRSYDVTRTDPNGITAHLTYNLANQFCSLVYADVEWEAFYDSSGTRCNEPHRNLTRLIIPGRFDVTFEQFSAGGLLEQASFRVPMPSDAAPEVLATPTPLVLGFDYDPFGQTGEINERGADTTVLQTRIDENGQKIVTVTTTASSSEEGELPQEVTYTYDAIDRLILVESIEGSIRYTYNDRPEELYGVQVTVTFTDTAGNQQEWRLFYNPLGNLVEWQDHNGVITHYEYDMVSRLEAITVNDRVFESYTYNAAGQVTSITNMNGRIRRLVYNDRGQLTTDRNFNNVVTIYTYDQQGNLSTVTDALGNTTTYLYDNQNRLTTIIDPTGNVQEFIWDDVAEGRLVYRSGEDETEYYFDMVGRLWQVVDAAGTRHILRYDPAGRLIAFEPASGALDLEFDYGAGGRLETISDGDDWVWNYRYDNADRLIQRQDPDGGILNFTYDPLGRFLTIDAPDTNPAFTREYDYPEAGVIEINLGNLYTQVRYDDFYRLTAATDMDRASTPTPLSTTYTYTDDESVTITDPFGNTRVYTYSGMTGLDQEVFLTVEEAGQISQYILNARGELVSITRTSTVGGENFYQREETFSYDAVGRPIRYIDAEDNLYSYTYDSAGNLSSLQFPDGSRYTYTYDALHRLTTITNPTNHILRLEYNTLNQVEAIRMNGTLLEAYSYNALGWLETRRYPMLDRDEAVITYTYTAAGRPTGWLDSSDSGLVIEQNPGALTLPSTIHLTRQEERETLNTYRYDLLGQITNATTDRYGQDFGYDALGRLQRMQEVQTGEVWTYEYQENGSGYTLRLGADGTRQLEFLLDENLRLQQMSANEVPVDVAYNLRNDTLEVRLTWGDGYNSQVRFDALGHIVRVVHDRQGDISFNRAAFTYSLNYFGLPLSVDETSHDVLLGYDGAYRPTTTRWLYTGTDRDRPRDSIEYAFTLTYDNLGNRRTELQQDPDGVQRLYRYDVDNKLLRQRSLNTALTAGYLLGVASLIVVVRRRKLILALLLLVLPLILIGTRLTARTETPPELEYRYNAIGNLVEIATTETGASTRFTYDGMGHLTSIIYPDETSSLFSYDAFGRLITWDHPALGVLNYRYNGDQLVAINQGMTRKIVLSAADSPLLLVQGEESTWGLYDGLNDLRQTFTNTHTEGQSIIDVDFFGVLLTDLADQDVPLQLPIFKGMLYDATAGIYIALDGRAYDPTSGRYLQRDMMGPDATGNVYTYRHERTSLPVRYSNPLPFTEGLQTLINAQSQVEIPTADTIRAQIAPSMSLAWEDVGLSSLQAFNQTNFAAVEDFLTFPAWLATHYNPPGVVVQDGEFALLNAHHPQWTSAAQNLTAPFELPNNSIDPIPAGDTLAFLFDAGTADFDVPRWNDPDGWRSLEQWQPDFASPSPVQGQRSPDLIMEQLPYPLQDFAAYAGLFNALENLPVKDGQDWLAEIDAATLPNAPELPPANGQDWLDQWFTNETFPTWGQLAELHSLPPAPSAPQPTLSLEGE